MLLIFFIISYLCFVFLAFYFDLWSFFCTPPSLLSLSCSVTIRFRSLGRLIRIVQGRAISRLFVLRLMQTCIQSLLPGNFRYVFFSSFFLVFRSVNPFFSSNNFLIPSLVCSKTEVVLSISSIRCIPG